MFSSKQMLSRVVVVNAFHVHDIHERQ